MTFDNDQAFSLHMKIAKDLNIKTFFTRPYTSQDKGSIENRNGVIRRFFPKKTDFTEVSANDVKKVEKMINNRPVRKFNYKTPNEVVSSSNKCNTRSSSFLFGYPKRKDETENRNLCCDDKKLFSAHPRPKVSN